MRVEIQRSEVGSRIVYKNVRNAYIKGSMYCILFEDRDGQQITHRYPVSSIFRVIEEYPENKRA